MNTEYKVISTNLNGSMIKATFTNEKDAKNYKDLEQQKNQWYNQLFTIEIEKCNRQHIIISYDHEMLIYDGSVLFKKYYFDNEVSQSDFKKQITKIFEDLGAERSCKRIVNKIVSRFETKGINAALNYLEKFRVYLRKFKHFYNESPDDVLHFFKP